MSDDRHSADSLGANSSKRGEGIAALEEVALTPDPTLSDLLERTRAAMASGRVLHDPERTGGPCPECDEPWPCAERKRQRQVKKLMMDYLWSDLYKRADLLPTDPPGIRCTSPLGWSVWLTYGHGGIPVTIRTPDGQPWASTTSGDIFWLEETLP